MSCLGNENQIGWPNLLPSISSTFGTKSLPPLIIFMLLDLANGWVPALLHACALYHYFLHNCFSRIDWVCDFLFKLSSLSHFSHSFLVTDHSGTFFFFFLISTTYTIPCYHFSVTVSAHCTLGFCYYTSMIAHYTQRKA